MSIENKKKGAQMPEMKKSAITFMTAVMTMAVPHAAASSNDTPNNARVNKQEKVSDAARKTIGCIVKCQDGKSKNPNISVTDYYIDCDGDGRHDVVLQCINRDGDTYISQETYSPFSVVEFIEEYNQKNRMWNIISTKVIDTRKPKTR